MKTILSLFCMHQVWYSDRDLVDLREAAEQFNETREFQERFRTWIQAYRRRPGLMERLRRQQFVLP